MLRVLTVLILIFVATFCFFPVQSEDLFMYLALGREFFQKGQFPLEDPFMFPSTTKWTILHQWLSYLIFYGIFLVGGYGALIATKTTVILAALSYPLIWLRQNWMVFVIWAISVILGMFAMSFRLVERTSLFSDVFLMVLIGILIKELEKPSRWKFIIPLIFLFWVNLHPGFPTGWVICGLAILASLRGWRTRAFRDLCLVTLASVFVCFLNPRGLNGVLYPFVFSQQEGRVFRRLYYEWFPTLNPLYFWNLQTVFIIALIALNVFLLYRSRRLKPVFECLASLFVIFYGLYAVRFVPTMTFSLVLLNTSLAMKTKWSALRWRGFSYALSAIALLVAVKNVFLGYDMISGHRDLGFGVDERVFPVAAAQLIENHNVPGEIFNTHMFGNYLAWAWETKRKVFYHGFVTDTDFYLKDYVGFFKNRESFDIQVKKFNIKCFILDRFAGGEPLIKILVEHPQWGLVYQDSASLIFLPR